MRGTFRNSVFLFFLLTGMSLNDVGELIVGSFISVCFGANSTTPLGKQQVQWCSDVAGMCVAMNIPSDFSTDYYISMTAPSSVGYRNN